MALRVFPVEIKEMLVPRTHAMISWVPTLYDPVSVSIRHQSDPFSRSAEARVDPFGSEPISNDTTVSPSRRMSEKSENTIVIVHPGDVFTISQALRISPVAVFQKLLSA
jgi:hypothetical protein